MKRTAVINVVGLTRALMGDHTPRIRGYANAGWQSSLQPAFPALTCTAQSNYLTGVEPNRHGIVGNGWYNREYAEVHFWKQSNYLVTAGNLWEALRATDPQFTCANLFWWYNMYSTVDYAITPRPMYPADGRKVFDIYSTPLAIRDEIKRELGEFPFSAFWGPRAGIASSQWIAAAAKWMENQYQPTLHLIYLPHLDYNLQRLGPDHPDLGKDLEAIDAVVGELLDYFRERSVQVVLISEYGITAVDRPIHLNRLFRQQGWITIKDELGLEQLDCGASRVFAVADHQVAHVYVNDASILQPVRESLEATPGIQWVLGETEKKSVGLDHPRSGDLIAMADSRSWFTYYYWLDDGVAPDFARCVDIHRKIGYDPVELFVDPEISLPKVCAGVFLLKKKLGFRALLTIIPLDATLVRGSHGRIPDTAADYPVLIMPRAPDWDIAADTVRSTDVYRLIKDVMGLK